MEGILFKMGDHMKISNTHGIDSNADRCHLENFQILGMTGNKFSRFQDAHISLFISEELKIDNNWKIYELKEKIISYINNKIIFQTI